MHTVQEGEFGCEGYPLQGGWFRFAVVDPDGKFVAWCTTQEIAAMIARVLNLGQSAP